MVYSLSQDKVAVVTDEVTCSKIFFSRLVTSIHRHPHHKHTRMYLKHVVFQADQPHYQQKNRENFNDLNSFDANVIIVLLQHQFIPIFLREVFDYELISSSALWIIPTYHDDLSLFTWFPEKIVSFKLYNSAINTMAYHNLYTSVTNIYQLYKNSKEFTSRYAFLTYFVPKF